MENTLGRQPRAVAKVGVMKTCLLLVVSAFSALAEGLAQERPANWAQAVKAEGLPNFHRVTESLYRSAQPWAEGFRVVEKMGIRTVLSLRDDGGDENLAAGTKLRLVRVPVTLAGINDDAVLRVLAEMEKRRTARSSCIARWARIAPAR